MIAAVAIRSASVAIVLLLAACSGDDGGGRAETVDTTTPGSGPTPTTQTTPTTPVSSIDGVVLTLDDMPPGYSPVPSNDDEDDEPDPLCEGVAATEVEPIEDVDGEQFAAGQTGPFISSSVGAYTDAATAAGQLDYLVDAIARCGNTIDLVNEDGSTAQATLSPLSFNEVGDRTIAFRGTVEDGPVPVTFDQITAQVDNILILLTDVTSFGATPDAALLEQLMTTMAERAS